jgi:O-antigen/teichoic acid export membrane protein
MPRMAKLHTEGRHEEMLVIYRSATRLACVIAGSTAITIAVYAEQILFAWTGDSHLVEQAALILRLYAIGNGLLALTAFPYYLQYAKGELRYHLIGNIITTTIFLPLIIFSATYYGGAGGGYAWAGINGTYLILGTAYIHSKMEPGLHFDWLTRDIMKILIPSTIPALLADFLFNPEERLPSVFLVFLAGMATLIVAILFSGLLKDCFFKKNFLPRET